MINRKENFALASSGAKIMEKSGGIQGAGKILNDIRDDYSIAQCDQPKEFVVSLSEDLNLEALEFVNYEEFSSSINEFYLFGSDEFPAKQWKKLGYFKSKNSYSQDWELFKMTNPYHVRYIKIKWISHRGSSPYCCTTQIRVYGNTMMSQIKKTLKKEFKENKVQKRDSEVKIAKEK